MPALIVVLIIGLAGSFYLYLDESARISGEEEVRNVILLIGDGMGPGQLTAAEIVNGNDSLAILSLPYMSMVTTYSASNYVTDSAASATALATGYKTNNLAISMSPEGENLITVVEVAETLGMSTSGEMIPLININQAPLEILVTLPGIGPATAEKIIAFREEHLFTKIEEIQKVSGIGPTTFKDIKIYLTVGE